MILKTLLAIFSIALVMPVLSSCNTMEGIGQDIQKGGEGLEKSADKNKNY